MDLPPHTDPCWQRLAAGGLVKLRTQHLGTQLMIKRIERSTEPLNVKVAEIQAFFAKWQKVLPQEVAQLARL